MEAKHKKSLIVALLAVVLVMSVGYAAFAQQLNITGDATITSRWDVHFQEGAATYQTNSIMGTNPTGDVTVAGGGLTATFTAKLISPGDTITYTIPIENTGTINAKLSTITLNGSDLDIPSNGLTATSKDGNIRYTVTSPGEDVLAPNNTAQLKIVAEFVNKTAGNDNAYNSTASLTVTLTYVQAQ